MMGVAGSPSQQLLIGAGWRSKWLGGGHELRPTLEHRTIVRDSCSCGGVERRAEQGCRRVVVMAVEG